MLFPIELGEIQPKFSKTTFNLCFNLDSILLIGQKETYTNVNINKGVIIGQYVGSQLLQEEYYDIYNSTTDELDHLTFMHSDILTLADGETVEIYIVYK